MVRDGIYYGLAFLAGALALSSLAGPLWALPLYALALFSLYFFRDPERLIPAGAVAVSPADGTIVAIRPEGTDRIRVSIFLNIFDVHVNRAPISGVITEVRYQPGRFLVASREEASRHNEQNTVTIRGADSTVVFKQIAGLIARRIVFTKKPGDRVSAGERVGLIKFGSRVDVILGPEWILAVRQGDRVLAGSSVLARRRDAALSLTRAEEAVSRQHLEPEWAR
ncbi:MAG: phosphatidylserine decarboxylase [Bryobacteraceae bacterium]|jgi:phosphatidylserine decarboxylase|nr:phosphatidylserine decarboxylase [Bryobacteraceae bacterium]